MNFFYIDDISFDLGGQTLQRGSTTPNMTEKCKIVKEFRFRTVIKPLDDSTNSIDRRNSMEVDERFLLLWFLLINVNYHHLNNLF